MPSLHRIVSLDEIPKGSYKTPLENPMKLLAVAQEMESLCRSKGGMGLAAAQIGLPWRLFIYWADYPSDPGSFSCLVDCEYRPVSEEKFASVEGCLSLPGKQFEIQRYGEVSVSGKKLVVEEEGPRLEDFQEVFGGVVAVVLQHEIDHDFGRERMIDVIGKPVQVSLFRRKS